MDRFFEKPLTAKYPATFTLFGHLEWRVEMQLSEEVEAQVGPVGQVPIP